MNRRGFFKALVAATAITGVSTTRLWQATTDKVRGRSYHPPSFESFNNYYPQTLAEFKNQIHPVDVAYPPGDVRRYGAAE